VLGVPVSAPVDVLKEAQTGMFWMLKLSASPSASDAEGVKPYAIPAVTDVDGVPDIVGAWFGGAATVMVNGGKEAVAFPSLTVMTMLVYVPTFAVAGVPVRAPEAVVNAAQLGIFWMLKVSASPSASDAEGVKLYAVPAVAEVPGVPDIVGGWLDGGGDDPADAATVIVNALSDAVALPSLTLITMFAYVPVWELEGVPVRVPVEALKVAHTGLFWMLNVSALPSASAAEGAKE
jgi:hypothetical protein